MEECTVCNNSTHDTDLKTVDRTCPAVGYQKLSVCVPVTVTPFSHAGYTKTKCCGEPKVMPNAECCKGKKNGFCSFTISQTICVEVPVEFGAKAVVGDTFVDCLGASSKDICDKCEEREMI